MNFKVKVFAEIKLTEDSEKVKKSILNIFPDMDIREKENEIVGESEAEHILSRFIELVYSEAIRDTVNMVLKEGTHNSKISFSMNKQAAFAGRVNLSKISPLGNIKVKIYVDNPYEFIDRIVPRTI